MNNSFAITICPTCGSNDIHTVLRNLTRVYKGKQYSVPNVALHECANCGEVIYDRAAMRKIEAYSPAYQQAEVPAEA
jgi:YgiT-type zinc finger domain-containing protein